jgi:diguanylate cyclase (GGDEF)-like protein
LPDPIPTPTPNRKKRSLIIGTALFVFLVGLSLGGLMAWNSWQTRVNKLKDTEVSTGNMARALAQHATDTIKGVDNILASMTDIAELNGLQKMPLEDVHHFMMLRVMEQSVLHGLFLYDENGWTITNSQKVPARTNIADHEYFSFHKEFADRDLHVGPPVYSKTTGVYILTISRRLNHPDGSFAGVAVATITIDYFRNFYEQFDIGDSGVIFLANDSGTLLVRNPYSKAAIDTNISSGPVFNEYRTKGPVGTAMLVSPIDHTKRLYSYRHLDDYPLLVAVALSEKDILAGWRTETYRIVSVSAVVLMLLGAFGFYLIFQINKRETAENELRNAKLSLETLNRELETLASEDGLTGLSNRRKFDAALDAEFNRALRNRSSLALIMIDVDRFKQFNDLYGHPAGDDCLIKISHAFKGIPHRPGDLAARYGGEEMVALLPDTDERGAAAIAERIRAAIQALGIVHSANPGGMVTISAGVAVFRPVQGKKSLDLLQAADEALYNAKAQGRNRVCIATL